MLPPPPQVVVQPHQSEEPKPCNMSKLLHHLNLYHLRPSPLHLCPAQHRQLSKQSLQHHQLVSVKHSQAAGVG